MITMCCAFAKLTYQLSVLLNVHIFKLIFSKIMIRRISNKKLIDVRVGPEVVTDPAFLVTR